MLNPYLRRTDSPPIPEAKAWASHYRGDQGPLLDLSQAVPTMPPHPEFLRRMADTAAQAAMSAYGPIRGDANLVDAYAAHVSRVYRAKVRPGSVAITAGANQGFFATIIALASAGDAVILPSPWYFNHKMTLDMLGIEARLLECGREDGFIPDPETASRLIDDRVKAIVLVTPSNPTGAVLSADTITAFHELCRRRRISLVLDETYRDFLDKGTPHDLFETQDWQEDLVQIYSFSKAYCIPGQRLGAIVAGQRTIVQIEKVLDCIQICPSRAAQPALAWGLDALADWRAANRDRISSLAKRFIAAMNASEAWRVASIGAYFAYAHLKNGADGVKIAKTLVARAGILGLPGAFFEPGPSPCIRFSFANVTEDTFDELIKRLPEADAYLDSPD